MMMMTEQVEMFKKQYKGSQNKQTKRLELKLLTYLSRIQQLEESGRECVLESNLKRERRNSYRIEL